MNKNTGGFTLIELMIVIAIIGILAGIAYPSYVSHVVKSNRAAAEGFMMGVANKEEQYMLDARSYLALANNAAFSTLGAGVPTEVSANYNLSVAVDNTATPPTYTITAVPIGAQYNRDAACLNLTLNQAGTKGISGTGTVAGCW